jgi:cobalt-zinc-cadmium efflux system outer membrane protein
MNARRPSRPSSTRPLRAGWGVVLLVLSGCALNQAADHEVTAALERYQRSAVDEAGRYARAARPGAASRPTAATPASQPGPVEEMQALRDYIAAALQDNPDIKAAEATARAKAARVPQATALPDPMISTRTLPEPVQTAAGDNYFNLGVSFKFPVPEKLDRAGRVALQEARMALEDLQRTRLSVIADVKRVYFRLYVLDWTIEIDEANQDLVRGLIDVARAQVATGRRTQGDVLRAEVELSTLDSKLIELRQERTTAAAMLNRLLNRPPTTAVPRPGSFDVRTVDTRLEALFALAIDKNPDVQRLRAQIERDRQAVKLARLGYWPEFTVGFEWMLMEPRAAFVPPPNPTTGLPATVSRLSETGGDSWAVMFGFNIPVWVEKIEAGIREARSRLMASESQYVGVQNRVCFQIEDAFARVRAQQELAALFSTTIIPQAQQAYEVSRDAYQSGSTDFLFVIDNWQKWLSFTIQYHYALGELERSVADLEEALGQSVAEAGGGS